MDSDLVAQAFAFDDEGQPWRGYMRFLKWYKAHMNLLWGLGLKVIEWPRWLVWEDVQPTKGPEVAPTPGARIGLGPWAPLDVGGECIHLIGYVSDEEAIDLAGQMALDGLAVVTVDLPGVKAWNFWPDRVGPEVKARRKMPDEW